MPAKQTPGVEKKSRTITEKSSSSQSTSTMVKIPVQKHKMTLCQDRNDKIKEESHECSVVTKNICKNNSLFEALPSFGIESKSNDLQRDRKAEYAKIPAPCSFYKDTKNTLAALGENAGNSDALTSKLRSSCEDMHSPQIDLSPSLLSPTAAFLLSFPVVSSTLTKPVEPAGSYVESIQKIKQG